MCVCVCCTAEFVFAMKQIPQLLLLVAFDLVYRKRASKSTAVMIFTIFGREVPSPPQKKTVFDLHTTRHEEEISSDVQSSETNSGLYIVIAKRSRKIARTRNNVVAVAAEGRNITSYARLPVRVCCRCIPVCTHCTVYTETRVFVKVY